MKQKLIVILLGIMLLTSCTPGEMERGEEVPNEPPNFDRHETKEKIEDSLSESIDKEIKKLEEFKNRPLVPDEIKEEIIKQREKMAKWEKIMDELITKWENEELDATLPDINIDVPDLDVPDLGN